MINAKKHNDKRAVEISIFTPLSWKTKMEFIQRLVSDSQVIVSLVGEPGGGKTTFLKHLQSCFSSEIRTQYFKINPLTVRNAILRQLSETIAGDKTSHFISAVETVNRAKVHVVLLLDDVHFMQPDLLQEILEASVKGNTHGYFHLCIASDATITPMLNRFAENYKDIMHTIKLGPLTESETRLYIQQRLLEAFGAGKLVSDERMKGFYRQTSGNFGDITIQMDQFFEGSKKIGRALKSSRYVGAAVLTGFIALCVTLFRIPAGEVAATQPKVTKASPVRIQHIHYASKIAPYYSGANRQAIEVASLRRVDLIVPMENETNPTSSMVVLDKVLVVPKVLREEPKKVIAENNPVLAKKEVKDKIVLKTLVGTPKVVPPAPIVHKIIPQQSRYTIQLMGSRKRSDLLYFISANHLKGKIRIHHTFRSGQPWYVLTLGDFVGKEFAKVEVRRLPKGAQQFKPWVRQTSDFNAVG